MPGGNFDYELRVSAGGVEARGPLDASVTAVKEMCIWVFQKRDDEDAIAFAMGQPQNGVPGGLHVFVGAGVAHPHWEFLLPRKFCPPPQFVNGSATAMGIGVFKATDDDGEEHQTVYWWSEAVTLDVH